MDGQLVEVLGRNRLVVELLEAGIEAAIPLRDRGVDLIAYADLKSSEAQFGAKLIQIKAASKESFAIEERYEKFSNLILACVWHVASNQRPATYALPYPEAIEIGKQMGWLETDSWRLKGAYRTGRPSSVLKEKLRPYWMNSARWNLLLAKSW